MACACNKGTAARRRPFTIQNPPKTDTSSSSGSTTTPTNTTQAFSLVMPDGTSTSYSTKLEADAARVRAGYRGTVMSI